MTIKDDSLTLDERFSDEFLLEKSVILDPSDQSRYKHFEPPGREVRRGKYAIAGKSKPASCLSLMLL